MGTIILPRYLGISQRADTSVCGITIQRVSSMLANQVATLLHSIIPSNVRRAEWTLLHGGATDTETSDALRELLDFHAAVLSPIAEHFAFSLPSCAALDAIARYAPCGVIESGAGNGLWAAILREHGVAVCAMDDGIRHDGSPVRPFGHVVLSGPTPVSDVAHDVALFLCWPSLELELSVTALDGASTGEVDAGPPNLSAYFALQSFGGDILFVVGEWRGHVGLLSSLSWRTACGQTAGAQFQDAVEGGWDLAETILLPRWPGFADVLRIFRRRALDMSERRLPSHIDFPNPQRVLVPGSSLGEVPPLRSPSLEERLQALSDCGLSQPAVIAATIALHQMTSLH